MRPADEVNLLRRLSRCCGYAPLRRRFGLPCSEGSAASCSVRQTSSKLLLDSKFGFCSRQSRDTAKGDRFGRGDDSEFRFSADAEFLLESFQNIGVEPGRDSPMVEGSRQIFRRVERLMWCSKAMKTGSTRDQKSPLNQSLTRDESSHLAGRRQLHAGMSR